MRALIIVHEPGGGPEIVGRRLVERDVDVDEVLVCPRMGVANGSFPELADPAAHDVIAVMGSTHSLVDPTPISSWIHDELDFLRRAHDADVPMLGICFGAQALSAALGGSVHRLDRPQIGWHHQPGHPSGLPGGPWMEWHFDGFVPPAEAEVLAADDWGVQAFRLRRNLAVQFHPEVTTAGVNGWIDDVGHELPAGGVDPDVLRADCIANEEGAAVRAAALVDYFLDHIANGSGQT